MGFLILNVIGEMGGSATREAQSEEEFYREFYRGKAHGIDRPGLFLPLTS